jgi:hypothetical protein
VGRDKTRNPRHEDKKGRHGPREASPGRKIVDCRAKGDGKSCGVAITETCVRRVRKWGVKGAQSTHGLHGDTENGSHGTRSRRECYPKRNWA